MFANSRSLLRVLERERAAFAEERRMLVETICMLAGQPVAPTETDLWRQRIEEAAAERRRFDRALEDDLVDPAELPYT